MGNCQSIDNLNANEVLYPCCAEPKIETKEIKCGREYIEYYLENKIEKFHIDYAQNVLVDKSDKAYSVEIEPSMNYFQIMKRHSKYTTVSILSEKNPLLHSIPFPIHYTSLDKYSEHPFICYNFHPVMGTKISEMQIKKENIIFNDIVQEGHLINQEEKYLHLAKKFIDNAKSTEKIVENILRLLTEPNSFFQHLHKTLCDQTSATFLGSLVFTLNTAIRHNFLNFKSNRRCFRKAELSHREINEYHTIFRSSESKRFCWQSFATANLDPSAYSAQLNFNAIFVIDFLTDAFGAEIGNYSSSQATGEILFPAMSLFEIRDMGVKRSEDGVELLQISLVKIDQNPINKAKRSNVAKEKDLSKIMKVMQYELSLLKVAEEANKDKYTYLQDELNFFLIKFALSGPSGTPYENGLFQVNFEIPRNYPNNPPEVRFMTKIWHPNVHYETGVLKHPVLISKWKPSYSVANLVQFVIQILLHPEIYELDSANPVACKAYFENKKVFDIKAKHCTDEYAKDRRIQDHQHLRISDFQTNESRRSLLRNDLLSSLNSENFSPNKLKIDDKLDINNNLNYNYNNKNLNDMNNNLINPFAKAANDELNDAIISETIEGSGSNRNEALEKEEFQKVKNAEVRNASGNNGKMNNLYDINNNNNDNKNYGNLLLAKNQIFKNNNDGKNFHENEKGMKLYNGNNRVFVSENDFEEADIFQLKTDNHINAIDNAKKRKNTEMSGNGTQEKRQHLNYEVDFDSKNDINLSENYE